MTTRTKTLFVTAHELAVWLSEAVDALGFKVVLYLNPKVPLVSWNGQEETLVAARRAYMSTDAFDLGSIRSDDLRPGELGWLQIDVPRGDEHSMLACQVAAKSDWFDKQDQVMKDNPTSLRIFERVWALWRSRVTFPVVARNRKTGAAAPYRSIGYSAGAAEWVRKGGALRQEGVDNIQFELPSE